MRSVMILLVILAASSFALAEETQGDSDTMECPIVFPPVCAEGEKLVEFDNDGCTDYRCDHVVCPATPTPLVEEGCTAYPVYDNDGICIIGYETECDAYACPDIPVPAVQEGCIVNPVYSPDGRCVTGYEVSCPGDCPENCNCDGAGNILECGTICKDSDDGKNYYQLGEVVVIQEGGRTFYEDKCAYGQQGNPDTADDKHLLFEAYCFPRDDGYGYATFYCPGGCRNGACVPDAASCPENCVCDANGNVLSCKDIPECPINCKCDPSGRIDECKEERPVCGNGVCEAGEEQVCEEVAVLCKVGEPCEADTTSKCYSSCPEDCDTDVGTYALLNEKFKLRVGQPVKIADYDMKIRFTGLAQAACLEREVYATNILTGNAVSDAAYYVKISDVHAQEEETRAVDVTSRQITKCKEGQLFAQLEITHREGPAKHVSIKLGERKRVFGATVNFLDYYSRHRIGLFVVTREGTDCPEECVCSADGSVDCPVKDCVSGTILCPDGVCREECVSVPVGDCSFGCLYGDSCLPIGTRVEGKFCDIGRDLDEQLGPEAVCENNFECQSNLCIDSQCVEPGVFQALLQWFKKLF